MKKISKIFFVLLILLFCISFKIQASECPTPPGAQPGLVRCGTNASCPCDITDFFKTLGYIYSFIVTTIAVPLATIAIVVGAILMMMSAGSPGLMGKGKIIFWSAVIGLILVLCSYLIIDWILKAIGVPGGLSTFSV